MNDMVVKNIDFYGSTLKAERDPDGSIWVGVRWICEGIGLSKGQMQNERRRIQDDVVLSKGTKFRSFENANSDVLCLKLDFVPLWLAKIPITPKMKSDRPDVVDKLTIYQLKVKDVLADAFFNDSKINKPNNEEQAVYFQIPSYDKQFEDLNRKIDKLYQDLGYFVRIMLEWKELKKVEDGSFGIHSSAHISEDEYEFNFSEWKDEVYSSIDTILESGSKYKRKADVITYICDYMRKNYGIVWEQERKEYKERNKCSGRIPTTKVIYENEKYRSIFSAVLTDLVNNTRKEEIENKKSSVTELTEIIIPLIEKLEDKSKNGCATYKKVYDHMALNYNVSWKNHETRFKNKYNTDKVPSRKNIINHKPELRRVFKKAVNDMLKED